MQHYLVFYRQNLTVSILVFLPSIVLQHDAVDGVAQLPVDVHSHLVRHAHKQVNEETTLPETQTHALW